MLSISRRNLLQGAAAATLASSLGRNAMAAPKRGGHLRIGLALGTTSDNLDPTSTPIDSGFLLLATHRNTLVGMNANRDLTPNLAEKWESSKDFKTWAFDIRPGATFHSGKSVTTEDVIASLNIHRGKDSPSPAKALLDPITDVKADGKNRIVITLDHPNVEFPSLLKSDFLVIVPSKDGNADRATKDGTGPYMLDTFEPGQRMTFKRNPNYWDLENEGFLESAEVLIIADPAARMNALRSNQVDLVNAVDLKTVELLKSVKGLKVEELPSGFYNGLAMMVDVKPFDDNNVRMALKYAVNRQEMVDKVLLGHGTIGNDTPIFPTAKYFNKDLPQREYDPEKAKFYLKKSGLDSIDIPLSVSEAGFPGAVTAGTLFAASAAAAGIKINVTREPDDSYWSNVWLKKPFCASYWHEALTADARFTEAFLPTSPWGETHFNNERFKELAVTARGTADEAKRTEMYYEMQKIVHEDGGALIPMFMNYVWAAKDNVVHPSDMSSLGDLDGFRCITRWSMA